MEEKITLARAPYDNVFIVFGEIYETGRYTNFIDIIICQLNDIDFYLDVVATFNRFEDFEEALEFLTQKYQEIEDIPPQVTARDFLIQLLKLRAHKYLNVLEMQTNCSPNKYKVSTLFNDIIKGHLQTLGYRVTDDILITQLL